MWSSVGGNLHGTFKFHQKHFTPVLQQTLPGFFRTCAKCWGEGLWLPVDSTLAPLQQIQTLWLTMVPVDLKFPEHLWIFVLDFICLSFLRQTPWQQQSSPCQKNKTTTIKPNNNNKTCQLVPKVTMLLVAEDLMSLPVIETDKRLLISLPCLSKIDLQSYLENSPNYKPGF